jgi:hypothetical protein
MHQAVTHIWWGVLVFVLVPQNSRAISCGGRRNWVGVGRLRLSRTMLDVLFGVFVTNQLGQAQGLMILLHHR